MPRSTTVVAVRIKTGLAEHLRVLAASSGRSTNRFVADIIIASLDREGKER